MDPNAENYNADATVADPNEPCFRSGCMDSANPVGYDPLATAHDPAACPAVVPGCLDSSAKYYHSWATLHRASDCTVAGCGDPGYSTYLAGGTEDYCCMDSFEACLDQDADNYMGGDGWCAQSIFSVLRTLTGDPSFCATATANCVHNQSLCSVPGCLDSAEANYDPSASYHAFWTCASFIASFGGGRRRLQSAVDGCRNPTALNYNPGLPGVFVTHVASLCEFAIRGCTDSRAQNHAPMANVDDGSCVVPVAGCTLADRTFNHDSLATVNDGSCRFVVSGCADSSAANYFSRANTDDGSCIAPQYGCLAPTALNFDSLAVISSGCRFAYRGCRDSTAANYNPSATDDSEGCQYYRGGCLSPAASNFDSLATVDDGTCTYAVVGCTDSAFSDYRSSATAMGPGGCKGLQLTDQRYGCTIAAAVNFDTSATAYLAGSCIFAVKGCTDSTKPRFLSTATVDDGSCDVAGVPGCTDAYSPCYDSVATIDPFGACAACAGGPPFVPGCMDSTAINYLALANVDDGGCIELRRGCADPDALNVDSLVTLADATLCAYPVLGCTDSVADNYLPLATAELSPSRCTYGGCTDSQATNYNPSATFDTGFVSCDYPTGGCTASDAINFNPSAQEEDGTCIIRGCTDPTNLAYDPRATQPPSGVAFGGCLLLRPGCTDARAANFEPTANIDDGSCFLIGCTNPRAPNYVSWAARDNGRCELDGLGCTDSRALNYAPLASVDSGLCQVAGCLDSMAFNYFADATFAGVLCIPTRVGCTLSIAENYDPSFNVDSGTCAVNGCTDSTKLGYLPEATFDLRADQPGACVTPLPGCTDSAAANFGASANVDDGSCEARVVDPPAPPADALLLGLDTDSKLAELDGLTAAELQLSTAAFLDSVPSTQPDMAAASPSAAGGRGRRRRRRLQSSSGLEATVGWVAAADWRIEFARRIARAFWLPRAAVTLSSAGTRSNGRTALVFAISTEYLPSGTTPASLKGYAQLLPRTLYSSLLGIRILAVSTVLESEGALPPPPPPPIVDQLSTLMAPGMIVAIVAPVVAMIVVVAGVAYWYRKRRKRRVVLATVQPGMGPSGQLVQPLVASDDEADLVPARARVDPSSPPEQYGWREPARVGPSSPPEQYGWREPARVDPSSPPEQYGWREPARAAAPQPSVEAPAAQEEEGSPPAATPRQATHQPEPAPAAPSARKPKSARPGASAASWDQRYGSGRYGVVATDDRDDAQDGAHDAGAQPEQKFVASRIRMQPPVASPAQQRDSQPTSREPVAYY